MPGLDTQFPDAAAGQFPDSPGSGVGTSTPQASRNLTIAFGPVYPSVLYSGARVILECRRVSITLPDGADANRDDLTCRLALTTRSAPAESEWREAKFEWREAKFEERDDGLSIRTTAPVQVDDLGASTYQAFAEVADAQGETNRDLFGIVHRRG